MTFTQRLPITTKLKSPFWLTVVPISTFLVRKKSKRTKFRCGYKAVAELKKMVLDPVKFAGAEVSDDRGTIVAELE